MGLSDEVQLKAWMIASLAGDASSYHLLLGALSKALRRYFLRRLGADKLADAEDLMQDTLVALHRRRVTYDTSQPFTAWFYAIARYKLIDHFRRSGIRRTVAIDDAGDLFAQDESEATMARIDVDRVLETLPERSRTLVRDVKLGGLTISETARSHGLSEAAVKIRIHRGLIALANRFQKSERP